MAKKIRTWQLACGCVVRQKASVLDDNPKLEIYQLCTVDAIRALTAAYGVRPHVERQKVD